MQTHFYHSPLGWMKMEFDSAGALTRLDFRDSDGADFPPASPSNEPTGSPYIDRVCNQLTEYFAGNRTAFDITLNPQGTEFQQRIWLNLRRIPFGITMSYRELTERSGFPPTSIRAVGRANATNPISIIIPCHRVIGVNGSLTGYAGGLERKRALLELEGVLLTL